MRFAQWGHVGERDLPCPTAGADTSRGQLSVAGPYCCDRQRHGSHGRKRKHGLRNVLTTKDQAKARGLGRHRCKGASNVRAYIWVRASPGQEAGQITSRKYSGRRGDACIRRWLRRRIRAARKASVESHATGNTRGRGDGACELHVRRATPTRVRRPGGSTRRGGMALASVTRSAAPI